MTMSIAAIAIGWIAGIVLFNIGSAVAGRLFGFPVVSFVIGQGPKLFASKGFELRLLPLGGHVRFGTRPNGTDFEHARPIEIILPALAGPALLVAVAVLGGGGVMAYEVARTWSQLVNLFARPFEALGLADALNAVMAERGLIGGVALTLTKFAGLNLLPLAFLSGGAVLAQLVRLAMGQPIGDAAMQLWLKVSLVIYLAIAALLIAKLVAHGL